MARSPQIKGKKKVENGRYSYLGGALEPFYRLIGEAKKLKIPSLAHALISIFFVFLLLMLCDYVGEAKTALQSIFVWTVGALCLLLVVRSGLLIVDEWMKR